MLLDYSHHGHHNSTNNHNKTSHTNNNKVHLVVMGTPLSQKIIATTTNKKSSSYLAFLMSSLRSTTITSINNRYPNNTSILFTIYSIMILAFQASMEVIRTIVILSVQMIYWICATVYQNMIQPMTNGTDRRRLQQGQQRLRRQQQQQ
jgi:hypothetical protein